MDTSVRKPVLFAIVLALGACAGEGGTRIASTDPFCADVLPAVEAWLASARAQHPTPDDPRFGGTATASGTADLRGGMNPAAGVDYAAVQHQQFVNMMTLIEYDEDWSPRPYLAESWEVDAGNTEVTWHIRQDVYWHDGERTDAHDVAFTYRTLTNPQTAFVNAAFWDHWDTGPDGVEVIDDFTVRMRLRPHSDFLDPWRSVAILPEHLLGEVPPTELAQHPFGTQCPVGNGPFVFDQHLPDDRWSFVANPAFPEALGGRPYIDRYTYRVIADQTTQLAELLTGGTEFYVKVRPDQAQQVIDDPDTDLLSTVFRDYDFVAWNARRTQLADARVRRALTMATNREEIVDAIHQGYGTVAHSSVPPFHWAYEEHPDFALPYDRDASRALLEEAGWTDRDGDGVRENADGLALSLTLWYNSESRQRQDIAEIMQAQLAQVGVDLQVRNEAFGALLTRVYDAETRDYDGFVMGWVVEFRLDDMDLFHSDRIDAAYAWSGTRNPRIDELLEAISAEVDREEALRLWAEYQRVLAEEQPYTLFYFTDRLDGVSRRLHGVVTDPRGEWVSVRSWYLDPSSR